MTTPSSLPWGHVTLHLNDHLFAIGYVDGRAYYFESCVEAPRRARLLLATDVLSLLAVPDAQGQYRMSADEPTPLEERLGFVIGYLSSALFPDPIAEAAARQHTCPLREQEPSSESLSSPSLAWGRVTLYLDHEEFHEGYQDGRLHYAESRREYPQRLHRLFCCEVMEQIVVRDDQGHYVLEEEGHWYLANYLGFFVGFLSAPVLPLTEAEQTKLEQGTMLMKVVQA